MTALRERSGNSSSGDGVEPSGAHRIRIQGIGRCEVRLGRTVVCPDASVQFALLLYLGARAGERIARGHLLDLFWPKGEDADRKHALRQFLYRLKRAGVPIDVDGPDVVLPADVVSSDLADVRSAAWIATATATALPIPAAVLPAYKPTVSQPFAAWVEGQRAEVWAAMRKAALRIIESGRREGRWADVELAARRCVASDPLHEEATLALAESVAMSGAKAEAVRILEGYLIELGDLSRTIGLPARLLKRRISEQPPDRAPTRADIPMIGRASELAWLNEQLEGTKRGASVFAAITGPPGIGKTTLAREFAAHAEMRGWRAMFVRLHPSDVDRPLSMYADLASGLLAAEGALGAAPESLANAKRLITLEDPVKERPGFENVDVAQHQMRAAMEDLLTSVCHEGPLVFVIEDIHWLDNASIRLMPWLFERLSDGPVMWLFSTRPEGRYEQVIPRFREQNVALRALPPLDRTETLALVRAVAGSDLQPDESPVVGAAYEITAGNPMFVREVAAHFARAADVARIPSSLRAIIRERVARLPAESARVLQACAMLSRFATTERVRLMLDIASATLFSALESLDDLGILAPQRAPGSLVMHELWIEEILADVRPAVGALLHLRAGEILAAESEQSKDSAMTSEAARHLVAAGARDRALLLLISLAHVQKRGGLIQEAIESSRAALDLAVGTGREDEVRVLHARCLADGGAWAKVLEVVPERPSVTKEHSPTREAIELELLRIEGRWRSWTDIGSPVEVLRAIMATNSFPHDLRAAALLIATRYASNALDTATVRVLAADLAVLRAGAGGADNPMLDVCEMIVEHDVGSLDRALELARASVERAESVGTPHELARAQRFLALVLRAVGNFDGAVSACDAAARLAIRHSLDEEAALAHISLANAHLEFGNPQQSLALLPEIERYYERFAGQHAAYICAILHCRILIQLGDVAGASATRPEVDSRYALSVRVSTQHAVLDCQLADKHTDGVRLKTAIHALELYLERAASIPLNDSPVAALSRALRLTGRQREATSRVRRFLGHDRRSRGRLEPELALEVTILFGGDAGLLLRRDSSRVP